MELHSHDQKFLYLDRSIDLLLDRLRSPEAGKACEAAAQIQGIRTALVSIDRDRYGQTVHDLAELIAERDR